MTSVLLPVIVFIGVVTSYEDIKFGKIRNHWILFGVLYAFIAYLYFIAVSKSADMLPFLFSNALLSLLLAYTLWHVGLWSAGDAKLFFVFSFLIPVNYYTYSSLKYFPAVALLINIFVPVSVFLFLVILCYLLRSARVLDFSAAAMWRDAVKKRNEYVFALLGYFTVLLLMQFFVGKLLGALKLPLGKNASILYFLLFFIVYRPLFTQFRKKEFVKISISLLALLFAYGFAFSKESIFIQVISTLRMAVLFMGTSSSLLYLFQVYAEKVETENVKAMHLKKGSLLTEKSKAILKEKCTIEKYYPDGLTDEDVEQIKTACGEEEIQVYKTIPYAPLAFAGVVLTLIFKTSVIHLLLTMIRTGS